MPLQATSGAASYDAFGGGAAVAPKYIEDFFQTWLRTGTGSSATVTTGLNASINKSLVWTKSRSAATNHKLTDTVRGATKALSSNTTSAEATDSQGLTAFSSTGYTIGTNTAYNNDGATYVDWQWLATPKFFDVVTVTADASGNATFSHSLDSTPGCVILKRTDSVSSWYVWHRSLTSTNYSIQLQSTAAQADNGFAWITPGSSTVSINGGYLGPNTQWVAYLYAHNAGGFGLTGTDNVISCGSFTTDGSGNATVNLGYEPQFVMFKSSSNTSNWLTVDTMRGAPVGPTVANKAFLYPNLSNAESIGSGIGVLSTGFDLAWFPNETLIYIAIRRGPMKTPTTGTSVFAPLAVNNATGTVNTTGFPVDLQMQFYRPGGISPGTSQWIDRLRGFSSTSTDSGTRLYTTGTEAEAATAIGTLFNNTGFSTGASWASVSMSYNNFRRAPGFFDEVCYTGTGSATTFNHNLGVVPELMIVKRRNSSTYGDWYVYAASQGATKFLLLNLTDAVATNSGPWNNTAPTASVFTAGADLSINSTATYVAYLFASCPGVSKCGSFTGTGSTQTINCGFTGGARFVLIKATSTTGNWLVWDSARGIVAGNDPYLALNSAAAEVTNTDWVDTAASGFELSNAAGNLANSNGVSYVFLAVA